MRTSTASWDAIVVGAGVGGCVAAAELADAGLQVLLIEAGPGRPHPESVLGLDSIAAAEEPSRQWPKLVLRSAAAGTDRPYRQGYGVGGGSLINSLLLSPGDSQDYRRWQQQFACAGWGPDDMAPFLESAADRFVGNHQHRPGAVSQAFADAAVAAGHVRGGSSLEQDRLGVLEATLAAADGRRVSAADAFLTPAADASSGGMVTVSAGRPVRRVLTRSGTAIGVEFDDDEQERAPLVVVAAGAIRSPLLLAASGSEAPGIGKRLKDHPSFAFTFSLKPDSLKPHALDPDAALAGYEHASVVSRLLRWSSGQAEHGDLQAFAIDRVGEADGRTYGAVVVGLMRVTATGSVSPSGSDIAIVTGALGTDSDRARLRAGVLHVLDLLRSAEMSGVVDQIYLDERGTPASMLDSMDDEALDRFLALHPGPYAHPAGTCAMGPDGGADTVVRSDPESAGRVVGTEGLYVADASVLPDLVQGGLQLPVAAVAARIARGITQSS